MHERKHGYEVSKEDPRVQFIYDQGVQLFAQLPARVLLGETQNIDLPTKVTVHNIWRGGWEMEVHIEPATRVLLGIRYEAEGELSIITLRFTDEGRFGPYDTQLILTPLAKSVLKGRSGLLTDLFSLSQPLPGDIKVKALRTNLHRITLPDSSFLLKYCDVSSKENGHFQFRAYRHIRSLAEHAGHAPQQVVEKVRKGVKLKSEELIAITAPEPIFATRRTIAMTELKGFKEKVDNPAVGWRARTILEKAGLDLVRKYGYHERLYHFDEETGISTVAFVDIHPR